MDKHTVDADRDTVGGDSDARDDKVHAFCGEAITASAIKTRGRSDVREAPGEEGA
jgi:hypothetical protein